MIDWMTKFDWAEPFDFFLCSAMLTLTALGLAVSAILPGIEKWNRRFFISLFLAVMLCITCASIDLLIYKNPSMVTAEKIIVYFEYILVTLPMPMFTSYLLHTCGENLRKSSLFRAALALYGFLFIMMIIAQFTTFLYYITPDNQFFRGEWHFLLMFPMLAITFLNLAGVIRRREKLPPKYFVAFLINLIPLSIAVSAHTFFFVPTVGYTSIAISTVSMFAVIIYDQIEQYLKHQREIAHQRANIMVLQMRPHFIYNAMMSIYYLCAQNPKKAQQVTLDFTTYLRKNFTAIANEDTIPFADELEHTRAYLAVEQVQFEDSLCVEYDTPHTQFRLPPLTLQPIVENAVKHGFDPEKAPLHIFIKTRETANGNEIIVEDDGSGFDISVLDNTEQHTALANINQRLEMMCGGKIKIRPREGGGTVVTVIIP